jgi:hypothetical protein
VSAKPGRCGEDEAYRDTLRLADERLTSLGFFEGEPTIAATPLLEDRPGL